MISQRHLRSFERNWLPVMVGLSLTRLFIWAWGFQWWLLLTLLLITLIPNKFQLWATLGSFAGFLFSPHLLSFWWQFEGQWNFVYDWAEQQAPLQHLAHSHEWLYGLQMAARLVALAISAVLMGRPWRIFYRHPLIVTTLILLVFEAAFEFFKPFNSYLAFFFLALGSVWRFLLLPLALAGVAQLRSSWKGLANVIFPFWSRELIPYWNIRILKEPSSMVSRRPLVIFCTLATGALFFDDWLSHYLYAADGLHLPPAFQSKAVFLQSVPSVAWAWLLIFITVFEFIFIVVGVKLSLGVAILRNVGYDDPWPLQKPWQARSFHELWARIFHYYNVALVVLIMEPMAQILKPIRRYRRVYRGVIAFVCISWFGILSHIIWLWDNVVNYGLVRETRTYLAGQYLFYIFPLSLGVAISLMLDSRVAKPLPSVAHFVRLAILVASMGLIYFLAYDSVDENWRLVGRLFAFLFLGRR